MCVDVCECVDVCVCVCVCVVCVNVFVCVYINHDRAQKATHPEMGTTHTVSVLEKKFDEKFGFRICVCVCVKKGGRGEIELTGYIMHRDTSLDLITELLDTHTHRHTHRGQIRGFNREKERENES